MKKPLLLTISFAAACLAPLAQAQTVIQQPPMGMQSPPPGWQPPPPPATVVIAAPNCHSYTDRFTIGHETRITRGTACLQPDGSWALRPSSAAVNYVARGGNIFLVPTQPFVEVAPPPPPPVTEVIIDHSHHHPGW